MDSKDGLIPTQVYAGRIKDREVLLKSSSGGAFTALSDLVLDEGGAVAAAVYDYESHSMVYRLILDKEERDLARGSKYFQSHTGDIFNTCLEWLNAHPGKELLFVGTGCQAEGFRRFAQLRGIRDRAYIVGMVCHGPASPGLWRDYALALEKKEGGRISYLSFRDKRNGWGSPTPIAVVDGREVSIKDFVRVFYSRCALRPSCHSCPFTTTQRAVDMTIGDFWHIEETMPEMYDPEGCSLFLIHSLRGRQLFDRIRDKLVYAQSDTEKCWQANLEAPTPVASFREAFWRDLDKKGLDYVMKRYGSVSLKSRVKNKLLKLLGLYRG